MKKIIKKTDKHGKIQYNIDGKIYNSFEELPKNIQILLQDANKDGTPDAFEGMKKTTNITVRKKRYLLNDKEYPSLSLI